jgi:hypothetical protein
MVPLEPTSRPGLLASRPAALAALVIGAVAVVVALAMQLAEGELFSVHPEARVTLPFFAATLVASVVSVVRRERALGTAVAGLALAGSALALGWILALAIIAVVAGVAIYAIGELS